MRNIVAWYASLPKSIQLLITMLESAAAGVFIVWAQQPVLSKASFKHLLSGIGVALVVALGNWFKKSPLELS